MKFQIRERPYNNKGHRNFRPWQIVNVATEELVHCFTTHAIAFAAWEILERGQAYTRHNVYRKIADEHRYTRRR